VSEPAATLRELVESLAIDYVTLDFDSGLKRALGRVMTTVDEIAKRADAEGHPGVASLAVTLSQVLGLLGIDEIADIENATTLCGDAIALMQQLLDDPQNGDASRADKINKRLMAACSGTEIDLPDPNEEPAAADQPQDDATEDTADTATAPADASTPRIELDGVDEATLEEFLQEASSHLDGLEELILCLESNPKDVETVNAIFRPVHSIKGASGFLGLHELGRFAHEGEQLLDSLRQGKLVVTDSIIDVLFQVRDTLSTMIAGIGAHARGGELPPVENLESLIARIRAIMSDDGEDDLGEESRLGEILVKQGVVSADAVESALARQEQARAAATTVASAIKVPTKRLDALMDLVGELVIVETQISASDEARKLRNDKFGKDIGQLVKITKEIQEIAMSLRMLPIKGLFQKMARLVRDTAKCINKKVNFQMEGEETEIDKMVIELIGDPLVHLIRNAVDHGIETTDVRREKGKPEEGSVSLSARHEGGNIVIELTDDGAGLDRERILEKAKSQGLIADDAGLTDSQIDNLIFKPGFSTAKEVTAVSGRGVGMDVVRKNVESLRGRIDVTTRPGHGSTFTVRLPLTTAIVDGMTVQVAGERYIIPIVSVEECLRIEDADLVQVVDRHEVIKARGKLLKLVRLDDYFDIQGAKRDITEALVVVVHGDEGDFALMVDELIGQQQVVIKSLESEVVQVEGISGGAIMGDGCVGLILDVDALYGAAFATRAAA
jgi:two-component system chemotaxis sensor kinase CheA